MLSILVRNWWAFVVRGALAILFGLIALFMPGVTMLSLVLVFAAYAIADGIFAIVAAVRAANRNERWMLLALEGVVGVLVGLAAAGWPALTVVVFVAMVAAWAILTGGLMLTAGLRIDADHGRIWILVSAIASIVYGVLLVVAPMIGALVLTWWIGAYALVFGISMLAFAMRLRAKLKTTAIGKLV